MRKMVKGFILVIIALFLGIVAFFNIGETPRAEEITWGVTFSQKYAQDLGLDWREAYLAMLDELGVRNLRISTHWDLLEPKKDGEYKFEDLDWKIEEAEKRGVKITLAMGIKTPRWPEFHIPSWILHLPKEEQQEEVRELIKTIILRYRNSPAIYRWQIENEPFFYFGIGPWQPTVEFVRKSVDLVRSLDPNRQIVITDTGEGSFWFEAAGIADVVGISLYRKIWGLPWGLPLAERYIYLWWFRPIHYWRRIQIINKFRDTEVYISELQAEPWAPKFITYVSLEEQEKTMNLERFRNNVEFAKATGVDRISLWGVEWWYWMKVKHNRPEIWNEAKKLFKVCQGQQE